MQRWSYFILKAKSGYFLEFTQINEFMNVCYFSPLVFILELVLVSIAFNLFHPKCWNKPKVDQEKKIFQSNIFYLKNLSQKICGLLLQLVDSAAIEFWTFARWISTKGFDVRIWIFLSGVLSTAAILSLLSTSKPPWL